MTNKSQSKETTFSGAKSEGLLEHGSRQIPSEIPVSLTYNGVSHVVMMASPGDLEDFALGFSLSEEIIASPADIKILKVNNHSKGAVIEMEIPKSRFENLLHQERHLVGQTGCGLCGVAEMEAAVRNYPKIKKDPVVTRKAVFKVLTDLPDQQPLNQQTRAVHAAAFADAQGNIKAVREDVGRHNAFDKMIGTMAAQDNDFKDGFALLTSRCSFELVQKALAMKIPMLATISAPTTLAVDLAKAHDLTLVALARPDSFQIYSDPFHLFG